METKSLIKNLSIGVTVALVLIGAGAIFWLYQVVYSVPDVSSESKQKQLKVDYDLYTELANPPAYGSAVSVQEPGYGRVNPFAPYKEPPAPPADASTASGTVAPTVSQ